MIDSRRWFAARRKMLESVQAEVRSRLGPAPRALAVYARAIEREYRGPWRASDETALTRAMLRAGLVLGADFHAYAQSQRAYVRLLRDRIPPNTRVTLALECVRAAFDDYVARFLGGRLTEEKFLARVRWNGDWGFPWANYRPLFALARERGWRVAGLNTRGEGSLAARDRWTARRLDDLGAGADLVFAVIGEWHVARTHVPRHLGRAAVTILQDVEPLYLARASRAGGTVGEVWRAPGDRFCLMVSPPWMKWQSYLIFLEQFEDAQLAGDVDHSDHVAAQVALLEADLGVRVDKTRLQVFGPDSRDALARLGPRLDRALVRPLRYHVEHDLNFVLTEFDWIYLSRATTNHAAALAGQFVHACLSRRGRTPWRYPADFRASIWVEAIGFFFSKWINPRRKADTLESTSAGLSARHPERTVRRVLGLVLDQRLSDVVFTETARVRTPRRPRATVGEYVEASRVLGSMLGERLFVKVRGGQISLPRLMSYLKMDVDDARFERMYHRLDRELTRADPKRT